LEVIDRMSFIHKEVEKSRGYPIPPWAYRDVLYMLIDYSVRSHELLVRKLTIAEKEEVYDVFRRVGGRMGIPDLPENYSAWLSDRKKHLEQDLEYSDYSRELYVQYRKNLGLPRFGILRAAQGIIVPPDVRRMLRLWNSPVTRTALGVYKKIVLLRLDWLLKVLILPRKYVPEIRKLET
jgi:hypothetical protein